MKNKKIRIRLYRAHDYDLMNLYYSEGFQFNKTLHTILNSYVNKKIYIIDISQEKKLRKRIPWKTEILLTLNAEKDKDIINFLETIKDGQRNGFLKNLFRRYLSDDDILFYLTKDKEQYVSTNEKKHVEAFYGKTPKKEEHNNDLPKLKEEYKKEVDTKKEEISEVQETIQEKVEEKPVKPVNNQTIETQNTNKPTSNSTFNLFSAFEDMM